LTKAAVQAEYRVNGSNQRDTGHWIWSAQPAAMAAKGELALRQLSVRTSRPSDSYLVRTSFRSWPIV